MFYLNVGFSGSSPSALQSGEQRSYERAHDGVAPDHRRPDRLLRRHPPRDRVEAFRTVVCRRRGVQTFGKLIFWGISF